MIKFSKNQKLNNVLNSIYKELKGMEISDIKKYYSEFKLEPDYNIAQYGNVTIYYTDLRKLYKEYKSLEKVSDTELWNIYKRQVGYVTRYILQEV